MIRHLQVDLPNILVHTSQISLCITVLQSRNCFTRRTVFLVVCLHPACLPVSACICLGLYMSACICLCLHVSVCLVVPVCICPCLYVFAFIFLCLHISVCVYMCLSVSWCLSVCTCPCQRVYLSVRPSAGGSVQSPWATKEQFIGFGWDRTKPTVSTYRRTCHILHVYHMISLFIGQLADYMWPQVLVPLQTSAISSRLLAVRV